MKSCAELYDAGGYKSPHAKRDSEPLMVTGFYNEKTGERIPFDKGVERGFITQERYDEIVEYQRSFSLEYRDGYWMPIRKS
jgi:hypothetical protein